MPAAIPTPSVQRTACPYCGVGCGILVTRDGEGREALAGDPDHPGNRGQLCSKGRTLLHAARRQDTRLLHPELRTERAAERQRCSWDQAIAHAAGRLRAIQAAHGRDAVALYVSGQCLTEEYYLANKLAKGFLGTNNIDTNSRLCMSSAVAGHKATLGSDCVPGCYEDLDLAESWLVSGANMAFAHPILFRRIEAAKAADPARRLIVVDPRRTDTAQAADLHLQIRPGSDVALHLALGHELLRLGAVDRTWIAAHAHGWAELEARLAEWPPERAAAVCGVAAADISRAAGWLVGRRWMSLWTMGLNQSSSGTDKVASLVTLSLITGTVGKPGCGPFSLTGQPNAMGGREAGGLANLLPAHRSLASAADRAWVEDFWRVPRGTIAPTPGLTAVELVAALRSGRCKAVWIIATNPVASLPAGLGVDEALRAAELVIVQDAFRNDTLPFADVVLPAATWPEKTGAMTTSERRMHLVEALRPPPGEARPDWRIIRDLAVACGFAADFAFPDEAAVFAEHAASTRGSDCDIAGVSHALLRSRRSVQWPCPEPGHPGTARLFADGVFPTPDGRCRLWAGEPQAREEALDADFPLVLTTGRIRDQWHTQTRSGLVNKLTRAEPRAFLELHPADASARGIADGGLVAVSSRRGACRVRARVTDAIRAGTVFLPMHWGPLLGGADGRVNAVTSDRCDPVSREPDLKYAAVAVRRFVPPARRIVVVGAGAAALAFCQTHAAACPDDRLSVLGAEPEAFYDRVLLPHLVAGSRRWDELRRPPPERVTVRGGCTVLGIDRGQRLVRLDDGTALAYDQLVLATGSRPAMALPGPLPDSGVLGLRRRADAEAIIAAAGPGAAVVVVGAGLLGLELADALRQRGALVTVLQRSERVMGRQLDATAAAHLAALLRARGLDLRLQTVVRRVLGGDAVSAVELADGNVLPCTLLVAATGTEAEDGLARAAGLPCDRGVLVDDRLATPDPHISAIGECATVAIGPARHRVGTTPGAAAQAQALSAHLAGDPAARWRPQPLPNLLKVDGLRLAAVGEVEERPGDEVVALHDPARRRYLKAVVRDDRVVGALCLGDLGPWPRLLDLCQSGCELDELRDGLLAPGGGSAAPAGRLVCSCLQVGEDTIAAAAHAHGGDPARVGAATRAGTGCGSCRIEVARICARAVLAAEATTA